MAGRRAVAKRLGVSELRVRQLIQAGVLPNKPKGEHDPEECLQLYIARLRKVATASTNQPRDPTLRQIRHERDLVELDLRRLALAQATGEVVPIRAIANQVERGFVTLRQSLISIGSRTADMAIACNTAAQVKRLLDGEIEAALAELKQTFEDTSWIKAAAAAAPRRSGRPTKLRQQAANGEDGEPHD